VALEGLVLADAEAALTKALGYAAGKGARLLVLEFSKVTGLDSERDRRHGDRL